MCHRRAEHGHDGIADVLLDRSAEGFDRRPDACEVGRLDRADVLRIEALGARGEAHEIDEEDGHDLALFRTRRGRPGQR